VGQGILIVEDSRSRSDTPHSVGLLRTSDHPERGPLTDKIQHSQDTRIHAPGGIRTQKPSKRAAEDPRLRLRGYYDRQLSIIRRTQSLG